MNALASALAAALAVAHPTDLPRLNAARTVVRATRRVRTKLGVALEPGDIVVLCDGVWGGSGQGFVTVYSVRNRCATSVPAKAVREVAS